MTFDELQKLFPSARESKWHQHSNGGGWVANSARTEPSAYVGPMAWAADYACLTGHARLTGHAYVLDYAHVSDYAEIRDYAVLDGCAYVGGSATVTGHTYVTDHAIVTKWASVGDDKCVSRRPRIGGSTYLIGGKWTHPPLYIQGSRVAIVQCSPDEIAVDMIVHTAEEWLQNAEMHLAGPRSFRPDQSVIDEYVQHIHYMASVVLKANHDQR